MMIAREAGVGQLAHDVLADALVLGEELANSFSVYQCDFQSWMTPRRKPPGWTF